MNLEDALSRGKGIIKTTEPFHKDSPVSSSNCTYLLKHRIYIIVLGVTEQRSPRQIKVKCKHFKYEHYQHKQPSAVILGNYSLLQQACLLMLIADAEIFCFISWTVSEVKPPHDEITWVEIWRVWWP
jgi:hypothetical protein